MENIAGKGRGLYLPTRGDRLKIIGKNGLSVILEVLTLAIMITGIVMLFMLPFLLDYMLSGRYEAYGHKYYYIVLLALLEYTDILGIISFWQVKKILHNVNSNKPFVMENAKRIRRVSICSAVLAVGYAAAIFFLRSPFVIIDFVLFAVISLALLVCAELFKMAVKYKDENELTI